MVYETSEDDEPLRPPTSAPSPEVLAAHTMALEDRARMFLESLGHIDHPLAAEDPLYALFQVAVDYRCMAQGYEGLFKRKVGESAELD